MKLVATTGAVYGALMRAHQKDGTLEIWSVCTRMEEGYIMTTYSLKGSDYPLIRAERTWDPREGSKTDRVHKYWLCALETDD